MKKLPNWVVCALLFAHFGCTSRQQAPTNGDQGRQGAASGDVREAYTGSGVGDEAMPPAAGQATQAADQGASGAESPGAVDHAAAAQVPPANAAAVEGHTAADSVSPSGDTSIPAMMPGTATAAAQGGQCVRTSTPFAGFKLLGGEEDTYQPVSLVVSVTRQRDKETTSSCTGVLYNARWGIATVGKEQPEDIRYALLPRIAVAKHCLAEDANAPITKLHFSVIGDPDRRVEYALAENGVARRVGLTGGAGSWFLDPQMLKPVSGDEPCKVDASADKDSVQTACFTTGRDRVEIITMIEKQARDYGKNLSTPYYGLDRQTLDVLSDGKQGVFAALGDDGGGFNWPALFAHRNARSLSPLFYETDVQASGKEGGARPFETLLMPADTLPMRFAPKDEAEAYALLNARLFRIITTKLSRKAGEKAEVVIERPKEGWEKVLKLYGKNDGVVWRDRKEQSFYRISAVGIKDPRLVLGAGDSGTLLIGEWVSATRPMLTVFSYYQMFGNLESVGGKDACTGDDLLCCEKI